MGACNPYRYKSNEEVQTSGLKFQEALQDNVYRLIYRVEKLNESMVYFLWNYDKLEPQDEQYYIKRIISLKNDMKSQKFINQLYPPALYTANLLIEKQKWINAWNKGGNNF